ncbi:MAG: hypothetical protein QM784_27195 [Polyangiaceae bacterium]
MVPFAVSRPFYRATGRTIEELYEGFRISTYRRVEEQLAPVLARGLREGRRLTHDGRHASSPRFYPAGCAGADDSGKRVLFYSRDDGHERAGIYRLEFTRSESIATSPESIATSPESPESTAPSRATAPTSESVESTAPSHATAPTSESPVTAPRILTRASGETASMARDCRLYFNSVAPSRRRYDFLDLFRLDAGVEAPSGVEAGRERLTVGRRAFAPDVAPDGSSIVYVTNRAGTTTLRIARLLPDGSVTEERALVAGVRDEQVFTPRFSHDGKRVAYGTWTRGGYRDIRIVELTTGKVTELLHDRAVDQQPSFSPDDRRVYFSSDRSGISNIYAYDLETGVLRQITNVRIGAFMPEVSPDGKTLAYVGYGTRGFESLRTRARRSEGARTPSGSRAAW